MSRSAIALMSSDLEVYPGPNLRLHEVPDNNLRSKFAKGDVAVIDTSDTDPCEGYALIDVFGEPVFYRISVAGDGQMRLSTDDVHMEPQVVGRSKLKSLILGRVVGALVRF